MIVKNILIVFIFYMSAHGLYLKQYEEVLNFFVTSYVLLSVLKIFEFDKIDKIFYNNMYFLLFPIIPFSFISNYFIVFSIIIYSILLYIKRDDYDEEKNV